MNPQDDVILNVGRAETPVLNAQRLGTLASDDGEHPHPGARPRDPAAGLRRSHSRADVVLVQVQRYGRIKVVCPSNQVPGELATPLPT